MNRRLALVLLGLGLLGAVSAATEFSALPAGEQSLLANARPLWPNLAPEARAELRGNAAHWLALTDAQRGQLRRRMREWDALPAAERARRRMPFAAWRRLAEPERQQLRAIAAQFAALPMAERQQLQAQFSALPADSQRAWWLGPRLGPEMAALAPLFAYVPEEQRPEVLAMLRDLPADARADLARLLPRLDEGGRQRLRADLLSASPQARAAVIATRLR